MSKFLLFCNILLLFIVGVISFRRNIYSDRCNSIRYKSNLHALKYDPDTFIYVSLLKPFGLTLEEIVPGEKFGVYVASCADGGRAKLSGKIYPGLMLLKVNTIDLRYQDFDSVMDVLIDLPTDQPAEMVFVDRKAVERGPAVLSVRQENGKDITINCLKGQILRDVLLSSGMDVYDMKGKLTNCGGGGSCGTCAVEVIAQDWMPRADFEALRLKKYNENARLSCNTVIEGDATVILRPKTK